MATSNGQRVATRLGESALAYEVPRPAPWLALSPNEHDGPRSRFVRFSGCCCSHMRSIRCLVPSLERHANVRKASMQMHQTAVRHGLPELIRSIRPDVMLPFREAYLEEQNVRQQRTFCEASDARLERMKELRLSS